MTYARLSGSGSTGWNAAVALPADATAASTSRTHHFPRGQSRVFRRCVSKIGEPASEIIAAARSAGMDGSSGKYAAPAFSTAKAATTKSVERSRNSATQHSGPAPASTKIADN